MTAPSHLCFAFFNGVILASLSSSFGKSPFGWNAQTVANILALGLGGLVPDMDSPHSVISHVFPPSRLVYQRWGHRTLLHSVLGLSIMTSIVYLLVMTVRSLSPIPFGVSCISYFAVAFASHILADCLSVRGCPLLYPYPIHFAYPTVEQYRLRTGNRKHEMVFSGVCLIAILIYLPVLKRGGAEASLHYAMASVDAAYEDFRTIVNQETLLDFKGSYTISKEPVQGRGLILEAYPENFLIFFQGTVIRIGENSGHIIATSARCVPTGRPVSMRTITFSHEIWSAILESIPISVLISGEITANHPFTLTYPDQNAADAINSSGQTIKLDYTQPHELAGIHIAPRTSAEKLAAEIQSLESSLQEIHQALTDSIIARNQNQNPYRRDHLFSNISNLRKKKEQLGNQLERTKRDLQAVQDIRVFFSGQLLFRTLFVD
jgi:membrane-bound metal-dependent hydrolase YbcI (DUF457 family)